MASQGYAGRSRNTAQRTSSFSNEDKGTRGKEKDYGAMGL